MIQKNNDLEKMINRDCTEILESGYALLDPRWSFDNMVSPFSRLYYIQSGSGIIRDVYGEIHMRPGYIYLIPVGVTYGSRCPQHLEKLYFHVNVTMPDGFDLFWGCKRCYEIKAEAGKISEMMKLYHSGGLGAAMQLRGMILEDIGLFAEQSGMKEKEFSVYSDLLYRMFEQVEQNLSASMSIKTLAAQLNVSESTLSRRFRQETGMTVGGYLAQMLLKRSCQLLLSSNMTIGEIADRLNFCDQFYFSRFFKKHQKETPSQYRKRMFPTVGIHP
ncbi:MAG: helix-turn-helix domain-containing protein [Massiliimalia sp.]|jgi:AraC-like DNA-binding protein